MIIYGRRGNFFKLVASDDLFPFQGKRPVFRGKLPVTPPKFNIDPEKWWLEDYFPIGKVTFQGLC